MKIFVENRLSGKAIKIDMSINSYEFLDFCLGEDQLGNPNFDMIKRLEVTLGRDPVTVWGFLNMTEAEGVGFIKWYNRRVVPYCKTHGVDIKDYPISPILLMEIIKLDTNIEDVISYFEGYLGAIKTHVTLDFLNHVAEIYKVKKIELDKRIVDEVLATFPTKLAEYKNGKTNLLNVFFGEYLKRLADKNIDKEVLKEEIKKAL